MSEGDAERGYEWYDSDARKRELFWALRSRVLTDAEMEEVDRYGDCLNIPLCVPYRREEKTRELNEALLNQFRMRDIARRAAPPPEPSHE